MLQRQKSYIYFTFPAIDGCAGNCYDKSVSKRGRSPRDFRKGGFFVHISAYVWVFLLILFLMAEGATVALTALWFAFGALAAAIAALLGASVGLQVGLFVAVSVLLLAMLRPILKRYVNPKIVKTNTDALIGRECVVTQPIDNLAAQGQVKVGGMTWSARSDSGADIPANTVVKIVRIEGVKLYVTPAPAPEAVK